MDKNTLDDLLNTLGFIAQYKSLLPFSLRGWVNGLGLFVQERKAGPWIRLQAGGKFRSYLDVWRQDDGDWDVKKFDEVTWNRRFACVVEPTMEIAEFLLERVTVFGEDLDAEGALVAVEAELNIALQNFRKTGEWSGLPCVPEEVRRDRLPMFANEQYAESFLKLLEEQSVDYKALGKLYFAALSKSVRGKDIPVWGDNVPPEMLDYSVEELQAFAKKHLRKAYEIDTSTQAT